MIDIITGFLGNGFTGLTGWFSSLIEGALQQIPILQELSGGEVLLLLSILGFFLMTFKINFFLKLIQIGLLVIGLVALISFILF